MKTKTQHANTTPVKVMLRGKFIARTYVKKERSQISNLTLHLKELDKGEQTKPVLAEGRKNQDYRGDRQKNF